MSGDKENRKRCLAGLGAAVLALIAVIWHWDASIRLRSMDNLERVRSAGESVVVQGLGPAEARSFLTARNFVVETVASGDRVGELQLSFAASGSGKASLLNPLRYRYYGVILFRSGHAVDSAAFLQGTAL